MILVECNLDSVVECLAVFWVLVIFSDCQWQKNPEIAGSYPMKGSNGYWFSEAWADTVLHAPRTAGWTTEAAEGHCVPKPPSRSAKWNKLTMKKQYMVYITMMNVCMNRKKAKRQKSIGFKVNLLSFDMYSGGHIYKLSKARKGLLYTTLCIYTLLCY